MLIQEQWIDRTRNCGNGETEPYEAFTDEPGKLYRSCLKEYGRCTGKIYIDTPDGAKAIGWVFLKRAKYDDCNETFLLETWITLHKQEPTRTIKHHYHELA